MDRCHIQTIEGPDHITVRIAGEVDLACARNLVGALALALTTERPVVVDCAGITFLDSTGLNAFLEARSLAHNRRIGFQLTSVPKQVRWVLELSGTTSLFDIAAESGTVAQGQPAGLGHENADGSAAVLVSAGDAEVP